jgi:hypothetical protein
LEKVATWQVLGEDPNCDMGGSHHQPTLGFFTGKLSDVITLAVNLPHFWQWGGGGDFKEVHIEPVDEHSADKFRALQEEKAALQARLDEINKIVEGK